jgi:hypothetical protein
MLIGLVAVAVLLGLYLLPVKKIGEFIKYRITRSEAQEVANDFLTSKSVEPGEFQSVVFTFANFDAQTAKYILLHKDIGTLNQLYSEQIKSGLWVVRYFKPLEKEEYKIYIDPRTRSVYTFEHVIAEDALGADLEREPALTIATAFLKSQAINPADYDLVESSAEKRPARRDHTFVWQAKEGDSRNIGQAKFRLRVLVQGDEVGQFQRFLKLPEDWVREQEKSTVVTTGRFWAQMIVMATLVVVAIALFVARARQGQIHWKRTVGLALGVTGIVLLGQLNELPLMYAPYPTSFGPETFVVMRLVGMVGDLALVFVLSALALGLMTSLYPEALGALRQPNRARLARDAVIGSLLVIGAMAGVDQLANLLVERFSVYAIISHSPVPGDLGTALPFVSHLVTVVEGTLFALTILGLVVYTAKQHVKKPLVVVLVGIVALLALVSLEAKSPGEYLLDLTVLGIRLAAVVALIRWFLRDNRLAYLAGAFLFFCFQSASTLTAQSATFFIINGIILFGIGAAVLVWLLMSRRIE